MSRLIMDIRPISIIQTHVKHLELAKRLYLTHSGIRQMMLRNEQS